MAASNWVLIPVQTEYYALEGMSQLMNSIKLVQRRINPNLKLFGIAMTMYQKTKLCDTVVSEVRRHLSEQVFNTVIPRDISVAAAPADGAPVAIIKKPSRSNKGSQQYWALAKEVHRRALRIRKKYGINEPNRLREHQIRTGD